MSKCFVDGHFTMPLTQPKNKKITTLATPTKKISGSTLDAAPIRNSTNIGTDAIFFLGLLL